MGYVRHNAIIATGWQGEAVDALVAYATNLGAEVLRGAEQINGYITACITPDGSKEGWPSSKEGDAQRKKIREWLNAADSRGQYFEWCEVVYGSDDAAASVVESAWQESTHD